MKGYSGDPEARDRLGDGPTLVQVRPPLPVHLHVEPLMKADALLLQGLQPHLYLRQQGHRLPDLRGHLDGDYGALAIFFIVLVVGGERGAWRGGGGRCRAGVFLFCIWDVFHIPSGHTVHRGGAVCCSCQRL